MVLLRKIQLLWDDQREILWDNLILVDLFNKNYSEIMDNFKFQVDINFHIFNCII